MIFLVNLNESLVLLHKIKSSKGEMEDPLHILKAENSVWIRKSAHSYHLYCLVDIISLLFGSYPYCLDQEKCLFAILVVFGCVSS